ncbi:hypothetical protein OG455_41215 [Kitasatospora sp. NBC_01287]|uniref:hypothetical protein n=1 Tax=Kitasatospora sp. NBC_01287 TaxID=2903573 RepID=UPI002258CF77|nr:hypothetical protein [Kitasatospora sp. NBC_01287]MCX4750903.1 hypothetical protein [Kitasatospora sp. NBC_01287]MCX4751862.1 hypothetical protein [Kitasatospora sp. NBC_01287]
MMARTRTARGGSGGATGGAGALRFLNRTITIMRGVEANPYGDLSDVGIPRYTGVQAAIAETSQTYFDAASQRNQIIRAIECIVPAWVDVETTDTLMDESTGYYYMIEGIREQPGIGYYPAPKVLTLRMRSGINVTSD